MKKSILTVGADPELFIINTTTNKVVSAVNLIPGVKGHPWRDPMWVKGYGLEIDNILAEFNIPPAENCDEFVSRMLFMREYIRQFVKKINPELDIMCKASTHVSDEELNSEVAKLFGCSVDYNAYTEGPNPKPQGETTDLRSTGKLLLFSIVILIKIDQKTVNLIIVN